MAISPNNDYIWLDGELILFSEAKLNFFTHSLHYAGAVFEGEKAYNGKVFKLKQHTERLLYSAKIMFHTIPYTLEEIMHAHEVLIAKNNIKNAYIRPLIYRSSDSLGLIAGNLKSHLMIMAVNSRMRAETPYKLNLSKWRKPAPLSVDPQIKSTGQYNMSIVACLEAKELGYDDSLVLDWQEYVAETTTANIFFVKNGILITPIADAFLNGITRQTIIELANKVGIEVQEKYITVDEIESFEECFITGSAIEIKEVESINLGIIEIKFSDNKITPLLKAEFYKLVQNL